jgi:thymidylate synthase (FAD)
VHLQHIDACFTLYQALIEQGICPEQARMVLPQNTMTEWIWSGTLGAVAKMLGLRLDSHTQAETRTVAKMIRDIVEPLFPVSLNALLGTYSAT